LKLFLTMLAILVASTSNLSSESFSVNHIESGVNSSLRFMFPYPESRFSALVGIAGSLQYPIKHDAYYIGVSGDVHLGLNWITLLSESNGDNNTRSPAHYGFSLGTRVFNKIDLGNIALIPFFGCDFFFIGLPMPNTGMEILFFHVFGIEYSYYFKVNDFPTRHQISIKIHKI